MMFPDKVFLASKSPRRLELLNSSFQNVQQIQCLREEPTWHSGESAENYLVRCLEVKSLGAQESYLEKYSSSKKWHFVVSADTIVVLKGELFGKPASPAGAVKMLQKMVGKEHTVMTAYAVDLFWGAEKKESVLNTLKTKVRFRKASLTEIKTYVKSGEPLDKSGSYGVQGPAMQFVESIDGSYQSVMGIPLFEIQKLQLLWKTKYS